MKQVSMRMLLCCVTVSLCVSASGVSQDKQKPPKFGWSLEQKKYEERKNAPPNQASPGTAADVTPETLRVETTLAVFDVLVLSDSGQVITGLKKDDFQVLVNGQPQEIGTFAPSNEVKIPRSIVLLIDYSLSQLPYLEASTKAAKVLVDSLNSQDRMAIVTDDIKLLVPFTNNKEALKKALSDLVSYARLGVRGASLQLSALLAVCREIAATEERPIIIQQTDGDEAWQLKDAPGKNRFRSNFSSTDLQQAAEQSGAIVYSIIPGPQLYGLSDEQQLNHAAWILQLERASFMGRPMQRPLGPGGRVIIGNSARNQEDKERFLKQFIAHRIRQHATLGEISALTGGWTVHLETPAQAADIYALIFSTIEQRYVLGYYPSGDPREVKPQDVVISIRNHPNYRVLKRKTHYQLGRDKLR